MKILVLSLLRTGDLFMHGMLIQKINEAFPGSEVHVLVNDLNQKAVDIVSGISKVHVLNRSYLQKYLVEENRPWLRAYQTLRQLVQTLNGENYDLIYNFSHTFFSARLLDAVDAREKRGVRFQNGQVVPMTNIWAEYLNLHFSKSERSQFHYIPLLAKALELEIPKIRSQNTFANKKRISLQVMTSDQKKNWSLSNFCNLAEMLTNHFPQYRVTILGAPDERTQIEAQFGKQQNVEMVFPKWKELPEILNESALLITGDTSVQHLATECGTPILSLCLGSANPQKTGPYQKNAVILQSYATCSPCSHSSLCPMSSHLCEHDVTANDVHNVAIALLENTRLPQTTCRLFQVRENSFQQYSLQQPNQEGSMKNLDNHFEQIVWQIYLDGGYRDLAGPYGTAAHLLLDSHFQVKQGEFITQWLTRRIDLVLADRMFLEELEQRITRAAANLNYDESAFQIVAKDCLDILNSYLLSRKGNSDHFFSLRHCFTETAALFPMLRKIKSGIQETRILLNIEHKLAQTLMSEMKERGHRYVSGIGKLPEARTPQA